MKIYSRNFLQSIPKYLCILFICITTLALFVPLSLNFPTSGLDPSWVFSIQQALAQNLIFGKDIIFTYGPYAAIANKMYYPFTSNLIIYSSFFLSVCYTILLLLLVRGLSTYWLLLYGLLLAGFINNDALFFSYPILLTLIVYRITLPDGHHNKLSLSKLSSATLLTIVFAPFGLLPLIKGSSILTCGAVSILCAVFLWHHKRRILACISIFIPTISILLFWYISDQPMWALKYFLLNIYEIISAYSEAMAITGKTKQILFYLLSCILILYILSLRSLGPKISRFFLMLSSALFLFMAFKEGFVRHDAHAITTATALFIAVLSITLLLKKQFSLRSKFLIVCILFPLYTATYINKHFYDFSVKTIVSNIKNTYVSAYDGLKLRLNNPAQLAKNFTDSLEKIHKEFPIPSLPGTTDIYSYNQAWLLASNNAWNPRPTFQSYSVYTPKLAKLNLEHLQSSNAPDNILFRIEPVDNRLPSLEDGLSWPTLINNYSVTKLEDDTLYLRKRAGKIQSSPIAENDFHHGEYKLGEEVFLPKDNQPIFAKIELKPTWFGKIAALLLKPSQLQISVQLQDRSVKDYRVTSGMMKSGFIITPLIKNTKDFVFLTSPENKYLENNFVKNIKITTSAHFSFLWKTSYSLHFYKLNLIRKTNIERIMSNHE